MVQQTDAAHWADASIAKADAAGAKQMQVAPRAQSARYDAGSGRVVVELSDGCLFAFPARRVEGLANASDAELAALAIPGAGFVLSWEALDVDVSIAGLMSGNFGTRGWMRELAAQAGRSRSPAKAAAARANGALGGRPKKQISG